MPEQHLIIGGFILVSRWKSSAVLAVSALAVLGLAGCGSQDNPSSDAKKEPAALELMATDAAGSLQKVADTVGKATSVSFTMEGKSEGEPTKGKGVATLGSDRRVEMTMEDPKEGPTTARIIGSAMYIAVPPAEQAEYDGKKWLKMDAAMAGEAGSEAMSSLLDQLDPAQTLKQMIAGAGGTVVGQEAIAGVQTVHYTAVVPVAAYLTAVPDATVRAALEKEFTKLGVKEVKVDLWADEQYQLRRVRSFTNDANDVTIDYTEYGKPVTIDVPPAAETADFAEILKGLQDSLAGLEDLQG
ncbi:hypothetical protein ACIBF5_11675 [Micromonospora sp. NPDC050417]|uniref:hypothetical protein n=1 Tax=Micromonospora sp. NPDC050417 TaxID=3364280 RepID=UPI00378A3006